MFHRQVMGLSGQLLAGAQLRAGLRRGSHHLKEANPVELLDECRPA